MNTINKTLLALGGIAIAAAVYFSMPEPGIEERVRQLESGLTALGAPAQPSAENAASRGESPRPSSRPIVESMASPSGKDLPEQVAQLAAVVDRLEQTARALDERIMRSRLAVPTQAEQQAQIDKGKARLAELRKSSEQSRAAARQIAASLNVPIPDNKLLERGASDVLEANEAFVAARDAASLEEATVKLFEKKLADLQFARAVEMLPPDPH